MSGRCWLLTMCGKPFGQCIHPDTNDILCREKRVRKTQAAMNAAAEEKKANDHGDIELQPEHEVLKQELNEQRRELLEALDGKSVKSVSRIDLTFE